MNYPRPTGIVTGDRTPCDCSVLDDIGKITHSIQDQYYHAFRTWMGWHWYTANKGDSVPVQEEDDLDEYLYDNKMKGLKEILGDMKKTRQKSNSAYHLLDKAVADTQKVLQDISEDIGKNAWDNLMDGCSK